MHRPEGAADISRGTASATSAALGYDYCVVILALNGQRNTEDFPPPLQDDRRIFGLYPRRHSLRELALG